MGIKIDTQSTGPVWLLMSVERKRPVIWVLEFVP